MKTKRIVSIVAVFSLAALLWGGAARAATITVNTTTDEVTGADGACSLREAIQSAENGTDTGGCIGSGTYGADIITLPAGTYVLTRTGGCEGANDTGDLDYNVVGGDLTINGAGAGSTIIDGNGTDRVLEIRTTDPTATVTLNDLTIRNGESQELDGVCTAGGEGGAIRVAAAVGTLNVNRCVITQNSADEGGGIYNSSTLNVDETTVDGNTARFEGGGIGSGFSNFITVTNSTISNNDAGQTGGSPEGNGGGLSVDSFATLTMIDSTVSGNRAHGSAVAGNGGGIFINQSGVLRLRNVTVTNNSADADGLDFGDGGGVWMGNVSTASAPLIIRNTIVAGNSDPSPTSNVSPDCFRANSTFNAITSEGFNLIGDDSGCDDAFGATGDQAGTSGSPIDPHLGPLANNGGPTQTHLLLSDSTAIDRANTAGCFSDDANSGSALTADQRGLDRPLDGNGDGTIRCDIGAVEVGCGNGVVELGETCDDGNTTAGDGCNAQCVLESCGDGVVQSTEGCDDGNTADGDGCGSDCVLESCGDGAVQDGEECDDGNDINTDSCLNTCKDASCGDGFVETEVETCDDSNATSGDGCSSTCKVEVPAGFHFLLGDGGCGLILGGSSKQPSPLAMILLMSLAALTVSISRVFGRGGRRG